MPKPSKTMALTEELVRLCEREVLPQQQSQRFTRATDADLDELARCLAAEKEPGPLWLFAYGSLIWKPAFTFTEQRPAVAHGWHRSFCVEMWSWRACAQQAGLMMALDRGGKCRGVAYRLPDEDHAGQIRRLVGREIGEKEDLHMARWIQVESSAGAVTALVFWAGPSGEGILRKLPLDKVAHMVARACGPVGSNAAYLFHTVSKLEEFGIRDRNLWRLQELVAAEIRAMSKETL